MGGSVRIPAAWCGVVGLKPGLGRIPMDVLPGLFDTISHHGPLARCADDARLFLAATQGPDDADILSVPGPLDLSRPLDPDVAGLRLGVSVDLGCWAVHPEIAAAVETAADRLARRRSGRRRRGSRRSPSDDEEAWVVLWGVFMAAYYGHLVAEFGDRMDPVVARPDRAPAAGVTAVELQAPRARAAPTCGAGWRPSSPTTTRCSARPWRRRRCRRRRPIGPTSARPTSVGYHSPDMTAVFNLVSPCPALSVPCGCHARPRARRAADRPAGRRPPLAEDTVLRVARPSS